MTNWSSRYTDMSFEGGRYDGDTFSGVFVEDDFSRASLRRARLSGSFTNVTFAEANLEHADFNGGSFVNTTFRNASVTVAQLRRARHLAHVIGPTGEDLA